MITILPCSFFCYDVMQAVCIYFPTDGTDENLPVPDTLTWKQHENLYEYEYELERSPAPQKDGNLRSQQDRGEDVVCF